MTDLMKTTAIVALFAAAPFAALAENPVKPATTPEASVAVNPEETASTGTVDGESVVATTESDSPQLSADVADEEKVEMSETSGEGTIADELPTN
ncbi:MAG: hypothetical protein AAF509_07125 [Pseudomonadota bacterium]